MATRLLNKVDVTNILHTARIETRFTDSKKLTLNLDDAIQTNLSKFCARDCYHYLLLRSKTP